MTLVFGAAAEDLLPKIFGLGFPILLASTVFFAPRRSIIIPVLFALAAGGAEDSLSALPYLTSASYFIFVAALIHLTGLTYVFAPFVYPVYVLWLCLWTPDFGGSVFMRFLVAFPIGVVTISVMAALLNRIAQRAALDEEG